MRIEGVIAATGMAAQQSPPTEGEVKRDRALASNFVSTAQTAAQKGDDAAPVGQQLLAKAVDQVEHMVNSFNESLKFKIHKDTNTTIITVVNQETEEVIREIPSEKFLDMVATFQQQLAGLLVDINR